MHPRGISSEITNNLRLRILSSVIVDGHVRDYTHNIALGPHSSRLEQWLAKEDATG
jgi:hypothetical protein